MMGCGIAHFVQRGWLIGPKLFRLEAYPACASSKLCDFIYRLVGWVCWEIGLCPPHRSTHQVSYSWGVGRVAELGGLSPILS